MAHAKRGVRAQFDEDAWGEDLARTTPTGRTAAEAARRDYEQRGIPIEQLRRVAEHGRDGTVLPNCTKVYLPQPDGKFGMVFILKFEPNGRPVLMFLAFGMRHHPKGSHALTVYEIAHPRLHPGDRTTPGTGNTAPKDAADAS
jgi:hypothetical protein